MITTGDERLQSHEQLQTLNTRIAGARIVHANFLKPFRMLKRTHVSKVRDAIGQVHLMVGPRWAGKTFLAKALVERTLAQEDEGGQNRPIVHAQLLGPCHRNSVGVALLNEMGIRLDNLAGNTFINATLRHHIVEQDTKTLIVDGLEGHLTHALPADGHAALNQVRRLAEEHRCDVILSGSALLPRLLTTGGAPLFSGLTVELLPYRRSNADDISAFRTALAKLDDAVALGEPIGLAKEPLFTRVFVASGGVFGRVVHLTTAAARRAVLDSRTEISREDFAAVYRTQYLSNDNRNPFLVADPTLLKPRLPGEDDGYLEDDESELSFSADSGRKRRSRARRGYREPF